MHRGNLSFLTTSFKPHLYEIIQQTSQLEICAPSFPITGNLTFFVALNISLKLSADRTFSPPFVRSNHFVPVPIIIFQTWITVTTYPPTVTELSIISASLTLSFISPDCILIRLEDLWTAFLKRWFHSTYVTAFTNFLLYHIHTYSSLTVTSKFVSSPSLASTHPTSCSHCICLVPAGVSILETSSLAFPCSRLKMYCIAQDVSCIIFALLIDDLRYDLLRNTLKCSYTDASGNLLPPRNTKPSRRWSKGWTVNLKHSVYNVPRTYRQFPSPTLFTKLAQRLQLFSRQSANNLTFPI